MINLKKTYISYKLVGEGEDSMLYILMHFRLYVEECEKHVGVNTVCSVDFFVNNHKDGKDEEIMNLYSERFQKAVLGYLSKQNLPSELLTDNLAKQADDCIHRSVNYFADHDKPYVINLEE